jgi:hypothetical protein
MKPIILMALATTMMLATSCGVSEKEKTALLQAQQAKDDSIRLAQIQQVKEEETERSALRDSLSSNTAFLAREQNALVQLRTAIYMANDEMTQIKGFHFGRLPKDRDAQIQNQEVKIQSLLQQQTNLQTTIQHTIGIIAQMKTMKTALAVTK